MNQHWLGMLLWLLLKNFKDNFIIYFVKSFFFLPLSLTLTRFQLLPPIFVYTPLPLSLFSVGFIFFRQWHITFSCAMNQQQKCGKSLQVEPYNSQGTFNANGAKVRLAWFFLCRPLRTWIFQRTILLHWGELTEKRYASVWVCVHSLPVCKWMLVNMNVCDEHQIESLIVWSIRFRPLNLFQDTKFIAYGF